MKFDVIIIGGAMVGATLACALGQSDLKIALIEAAPFHPTHPDTRLIALTASSCCLLDNLGIWSTLLSQATPIQQVHVSQQGRFGITRISAQEIGLSTLGHVVPAQDINNALLAALQETKNIHLIYSATLQSLIQDAESVTISVKTTSGTQEYTADVLIGADGSHSTVRQLLAIPTQKIDHHQSAIVTTTELNREHKNIAYERFQKQGAIAMLPLIGNRVGTVWTAANKIIDQLMQLDEREFLRELQQQFGYRLGRLQHSSQRATYPLVMQYAEQQNKENVLLIGNAAHTLYPIAAQGLNLAFYEVARLTEYLLAQTSLKNCIQKFPAHHSQQNFSKTISNGLLELFSNDFLLLSVARQVGMVGFDICTTAKKHFTDAILARKDHVPKLLLRKTL